MSRRRHITIWNVAALAVGVIGAALTVGASHLWMHDWSISGRRFPVSAPGAIDLPAGEMLVYYESTDAVPVGNVTLDLVGPDGARLTAFAPGEGHSYRAHLSGLSGRAMWKINVKEPGPHRFTSYNANVATASLVPVDDRIVFLKQPGTLIEAEARQKVIQIVGATVVAALVIFLYVLHGATIAGRGAVVGPPGHAAPS